MIIGIVLACLILVTSSQAASEAAVMPGIGVDYQQPQSSMSPVELEGLFEVMEAIAGDTDWRTLHPHPCSDDLWPGLVCEQGEDGLWHVTRLDFGYKPNPSCAANATIPPAIVKLSSLQSLLIFECFTTVNTTIPSELKHLAPSLQQLSLRTNSALIGQIPPELGTLSCLQVLSLSQNSLQGSIPSDLGKLSSLQHLDLSYNMLYGELPHEFGNLKNLVILDLRVNELIGSIPPSIGSLTMLQKIDLSFNSLEGSLPSEFGNLNTLEFFAMSDNFITGPFPDSLSNLTGLQYLIMDNNPMNAPLPNFLGGFQSILALSLSNSGYFGPIPVEVGGLSNLSVLTLDRNNLTGVIPRGLGELSHIYQLNLSQNLLSGPVPFSPAFVRKLGRNLDLDGNSGLCSHWSLPGNSTGAALRLCTDPSYSGYASYTSSAAEKRRNRSIYLHRGGMIAAAIRFAAIYIACSQLWGFSKL